MDLRIASTLGAIEHDLARRVCVGEAAAQAGLSRSRFEHLFKQQTGQTFTCYLRRLRMEKAKCLLAGPSLRIKEVAAQCGYSSARSFTLDFKKVTGVLPLEWRVAHLGIK